MFRQMAFVAFAALLASGAPGKPTSTVGPLQVDNRHSDAQLVADATTDYGKTKTEVTLGFARVSGRVKLDNDVPANSSFDFSMYPATSMSAPINEDGKFLTHWLANMANHTLVCFHSKTIVRRPDGRLEATGTLVLTRVDRILDATPNEGYAGPTYGPPILHRVTHEATFVFDVPQKDGAIVASGSTSMFREDFPQLVKAVVNTYWPPLVQDEKCQAPNTIGEDYQGTQCSGTFLEAPGLPDAPHSANAEDLPGSTTFNTLVANHLTILVHLHLNPNGATETAAAGD